jgi:hypothetical protein
VRDLHAQLLHDLARFNTGHASHTSGKHGGPCAAPGATSLALLQHMGQPSGSSSGAAAKGCSGALSSPVLHLSSPELFTWGELGLDGPIAAAMACGVCGEARRPRWCDRRVRWRACRGATIRGAEQRPHFAPSSGRRGATHADQGAAPGFAGSGYSPLSAGR